MPSKRGGTRGGHGTTQVAATLVSPEALGAVATTPTFEVASTTSQQAVAPTEASTPGFDAGELSRALRRGAEVDRFNEPARQQALTAAESDELYRYRLRRLLTRTRRLEQAAGGADEDAIREALDDFRSRLNELRAFEVIRRGAGLWTEYDVDRTADNRAITRLLALAAQRPHGLIAGSEEAREQPRGSVRIRTLPFAPSADDVPVYVLAPASIASGSLVQHVEEVVAQGAQIRVVRDSGEIPQAETPPLVVNWGSTQALPQGIVALNQPEAVRVASDQVESIQRLRELAPRTVANPGDLQLLGSDHVVAKRRHGTRGSGKAVIRMDSPLGDRAGYDLFQEFIPDRREYRVSVLSGRIASAYLKRPPEGAPPEDLRPAWTFDRAQVIPRAVAMAARESARRVGLDYAGVDVIEDLRTGRVYCLEANAAPGMSEETVKSVYAHIQQALRGRLARAG